jgi:hypothetical protein
MNPRRRALYFYAAALVALALLVAVGVVVTGLLSAQRNRSGPGTPSTAPGDDIEHQLAAYAVQLTDAAPYRDPTPAERRSAVDALRHVLPGSAAELAAGRSGFDRLGFGYRSAVDRVTGRRYAMFSGRPGDLRGWGVILVDLSGPPRLVVEVPHPNFDLNTERLGARLFRATPGAVLLMAGAHRRAAGGAADVAHNDRSMFHALAATLAGDGLPQIQLHGFADDNLPGRDAVVSTGTAPPSGSARRVADRLAAIGLAVCRPWEERCGQLEGTLNVQARAAEQVGSVFVHLELNARVRGDDDLRTAIVDAVAAARIDDA